MINKLTEQQNIREWWREKSHQGYGRYSVSTRDSSYHKRRWIGAERPRISQTDFYKLDSQHPCSLVRLAILEVLSLRPSALFQNDPVTSGQDSTSKDKSFFDLKTSRRVLSRAVFFSSVVVNPSAGHVCVHLPRLLLENRKEKEEEW